jgi:hypothetical protein
VWCRACHRDRGVDRHGGTGRFAGATGSLAESIDHNLATNAETVNLSGTISTPGSKA